MSPESDVSTSSPASFRLRWDVFLSFRGTDTRDTFTKDLYDALQAAGVRAFRDDDGLRRGGEIAPSLLEAIEDSAAAIVVLSPDYGSSHWCLEELAKICECGRLVLPVFYRVDPSDVRKQKGPFEEGFRSHRKRFGEETVMRWMNAMNKVGGIAGWVFDHNSDSDKLIRILVKTILKQMRNTPLAVAEYAVGLDERVEELNKLFDIKNSNVVKILGLYGMGGVGKTTLAKRLFNSIVAHFERRTFISNVRELAKNSDGLVSLQSQILGDLSGGTVNRIITDANVGISSIRRIIEENKVLVVLDDVDDVKHLELLIGNNREGFYKGSRVVITTRDKQVLNERYVNVHYAVEELKAYEAMELFCYHAMRRKIPSEGFSKLSEQIVSLTGGLPLALEVFGSFLFDKRTVKEWNDALEKLKQIRPKSLQDLMKISFDALDEQEKCVFLDIACLFVQMEMKRDDVVDILNGCSFRGEIAITVLTAKCLVKIIRDSVLWMHDQVRDMGRQIVQSESLVDSGLRSRLWDRDEILTVLKSKRGTRKVEGIVLDCVKRRKDKPIDRTAEEITWDNFRQKPSCKSASAYVKAKYKKYLHDREASAKQFKLSTKFFQPMVSLRLLQINYSRLEGQFRCLPQGIKWLQWKQCPLRNMPSSFCPSELAVLDLSESKIETVWGNHTNKVAEHLTVLNLSSCDRLVAIPALTGCLSLKKIILEECTLLTRIHESLGNLITLVHLNLHYCYSLVELPSDVSGLKHLEDLILSKCWKLKALPNDLSCLVSLKQLLIDETAISELPESIFHLKKLEKLSANGCHHLKRMPYCIGELCSLQELSLNHTALEELPDSVGSLEKLEVLGLVGCKSLSLIPASVGKLTSLTQLFLDVSGIKKLPDSIGSLTYLRKLSVQGCTSLCEFPESVKSLVSVVLLKLDRTPITQLPDHIGAMKMLEKLEMTNCQHLRFLPASMGNLSALTTLDMYNSNITELPESIGMLENLIHLRLDMCKELQKLPVSIGNLKSLQRLQMKETTVTQLPDSFGMLSSLVKLDMERRPYLNMVGNDMVNRLEEPNSAAILAGFCNLTYLEELNAHGWRICGKIPDDFEKLSSLETLNLGHNNICSLPASMRGMSCLKKLLLLNCSELMLLPPLPSSLVEVDIANCSSLQHISDISNLDNIEELKLTNCERVVDIPGIEHVKSLRRLYMSGCTGCHLAVKSRFSKVLLKNLQILIMPGSEVPDWFSGESVVFSKRRNRELKGVICVGALSFNHIPENQRDVLQLVDVQGKVFNMTDNVYTTTFRLLGVPRSNEDHIFLRRFGANTSLVHELKDKYSLHLVKRKPPYIEELELKKCGIHLVFEGDDDYEEDEGSLHERHYSVSQKLAMFFNSTAKD